MKKLLVLVLVAAILLPAVALADVDLSSLSFKELAELRDRCQIEMMKRDEWQEVTVPAGVWEVGKQIPAGTWLVKCSDTGRNEYLMRYCQIRWGKGMPEDGYWHVGKRSGDVEIYNPNASGYKNQTSEYVVTLSVGEYVYIHPLYNRAVFMPYTGAPSLGFK